MYHSITFGERNTWDDWHLVPSTRPVINPPSVKRKIVDIPGGDGVLDLSEALTGYPVFNNREGTLDFIVMNDYGEWAERYSEIMSYLHGRTLRAVLEDDDEYYYEGVFAVNEWRSEKQFSRISIDYSVKPYKRAIADIGLGPYADKYRNIPVSSATTSITCYSEEYGTAPLNPRISILPKSYPPPDNLEVQIVFSNSTLGILNTYQFGLGTHQPPDCVMYGPSVRFSMRTIGSGDCIVSLYFTPGRL